MMSTKKIILLILRLLVGCIFITSSILKLISLDQFEIYIYSFNMMSFVLATVFSRLLVAFEFLLGVFLLLKIFYKETWWLTMLTTLGFTLFLAYVAVFREDSNCHCFGELIELNPIESIVKNLIIIVLLLFIRKENDYRLPRRKWIIGTAVAVALIVPFVVFPMDALYNKFVSEEERVNTVAFDAAKSDSTFFASLKIDKSKLNDSIIFVEDSIAWNLDSGTYVMNFVASGCKFCQMGLNKAHLMLEQHDIDPSKFKIVIWGGKKSISHFMKETNTVEYDYYRINPSAAINIVFGKFPTFIWMKNGKIVRSGDFRSINESELVEFLQ